MIQIKNWSSFQSYKDRKPPWIRLHKSLLDNYEFHKMTANGRAILPMLWLLASEDKDPVSGCVRDRYEKLAFRLRMKLNDIKDGVAEIQKAGFIEFKNDSEDNKLHNRNETVTEFQDSVTPETETETETEEPIEQIRCFNFEEIWSKYPCKKGKHLAYLKFEKQVVHHQDWMDINLALDNYKVDMEQIRANGHLDRQWQHGSTWFNHNWKDYVKFDAPVNNSPLIKNVEWKKQFEPMEDQIPPKKLKALLADFNKKMGKDILDGIAEKEAVE